jgi:hypothetical protein
MDVWELNPEGGDYFDWRSVRLGGGGFPPFHLYSFTCLTTESTENLSQGIRLVLDTSRYVDIAAF